MPALQHYRGTLTVAIDDGPTTEFELQASGEVYGAGVGPQRGAISIHESVVTLNGQQIRSLDQLVMTALAGAA